MDLMRAIAGMVGRDNIPVGASIAGGGPIFPDMFKAIEAWKANGGKASGTKVAPVGDGTFTHIPDPAASAPAQTTGAGAVPPSPGWNPALAAPPARPGPVPPAPSVDRRGLPGRPNVRPGANILHYDPEGRPLYDDTLIAGQRTPGGPDTPLNMLDEYQLAGILGQFNMVNGGIGDRGVVTNMGAGTMNPPTPPRLRIDVDQRVSGTRTQAHVDQTTRHEGGHALDYWTERTQRGTNTLQQYAIPDDVKTELAAASAEMRPDLWAADADKNFQRSTDVLDRYRNRPDELMADGYRHYKEDPAGFKAKYPNAAAYIRSQVNDDPLLSQHVQFNVKAGVPRPADVPTDDKTPDADPIGDYRFPVGNIPLPGGYVLNDLLAPLTDKRSDDRLLPENLSLNDIGRSFAGLSPGAQVKSHMEAQAGRTVEGEEIGSFARLLGLFPAADALTGGVVAPATRAGSVTLGTNAGPRALTADKAARAKALNMARGGADPSPGGEIHQKTGWYQNGGGEWQWEISDHNARLEPHPLDPNQLVLNHPDLTANYPDIAKMPIHLLDPSYPAKGWYGRGGMHPDTGEIGVRRDLSPEEQLRTVMHEAGGHAVQDIEGFSGGSSPQANVALSQQLTQAAYTDAAAALQRGEITADQAMDMITEATKGLSSFELYQRQLGEYAARDIEARLHMTPQQRRQTPPYSSENIDPADLLTTINSPFKPRKGGGPRTGGDKVKAKNEPPPGVDPERYVPMTPALAAFLRMGGT